MNSKAILQNIEPLNEMLMATSILSNNSSLKWKSDSAKIIEFICDAYDINYLVDDFKELILNTVNNLSLVNEYKGLRREHNFNDEYSEIEIIYNLKGQIILQLKNIDNNLKQLGFPIANEFTYEDNNSYYAPLRLMTILKASSFGEVQFTVQCGLMYACAIGCDMDIEFAIIRLKQAAYWGYIPALKYLAKIYKDKNDDDATYKLYKEVYDACTDFFYDGVQMIPESKKHLYSKEAATTFSLLANIYQDVVIPYSTRIDYSFLEVMFAEKITFAKKMVYINEYRQAEWKSALNSTFFSNDLIGN
jgi:hypothetical protein